MPAAGGHFNVNCERALSTAKGPNRTLQTAALASELAYAPRTAVDPRAMKRYGLTAIFVRVSKANDATSLRKVRA